MLCCDFFFLEINIDFVLDTLPATNGDLLALHPKFPTCERNGVDQGVHNVLIHRHLFPNVQIIPQHKAMVSNLQAKKHTYDRRVQEVRNNNGDRVAIVHQYDRMHDLQEDLFHKVRCSISRLLSVCE